jgi:predicted tellurium resistance membrane protein TerC
MIFAGSVLISQFHWLLYVFGAFLLFTGWKMWFAAGQEPDLETNPPCAGCASTCACCRTTPATR